MTIQANVDFGGPSRAGQPVYVYQHGTTTAVSIFDHDGVTPLPNPVTTTGNGHVVFQAAAGTYDLVGPDLTRTVVLATDASAASTASEGGAWTTGAVYTAGQLVTYVGQRWQCATGHTAGTTFDFTKFVKMASAAQIGRGYVVPAGALDNFRAALKAHASQLCEITVFGDSTTYGNDDDDSTYYTWLRRLRDNLTAAGVTHGGTGVYHHNDPANPVLAEGGYPTVSASSGWSEIATITGVNGFASTAAGTKTFQGQGTAVRLNIAKSNTGGRLGYTVDGGSEVLVDTLIQQPPTNAYDVQPVVVAGLTDGVHTVVVRNAGASDIIAPQNPTLQSFGGGGGPSAGTYYYKITAVSANGESLPVACNPVGITVNGAQVPQVLVYVQSGWTSIKMYRATSAGGTYGLVQTLAGPSVGAQAGINDNATATPGAAPPSSSTLGSYAQTRTEVGIEFIRSAGVVLHKEATSGAVLSAYFDHLNNAATTRSYTPVALGMKTENQATSVNGYMWGLPTGAKPTYRNTKLVILQIGTNDIGSGGPLSTGQTMTNLNDYFENLGYALRTIRAAGADAILISPPFDIATDPGAQHYQARFKAALLSVALAHGVAYVDFQEAIGWDAYNYGSRNYSLGPVGRPHLRIAGYQAEADFLWANVFQPLLSA